MPLYSSTIRAGHVECGEEKRKRKKKKVEWFRVTLS